VRTLLAIVCIGILLALMRAAASVVTPFLLGLTLAIAFQPMSVGLARRGLPAVVAAILTTLAVLGVVVAAGLLIYSAGNNLASHLPEYQARLEGVKAEVALWLQERHMDDTAHAVRRFDLAEPITGFVTSWLLQMGDFVQKLFFVLVITAFIQMEGAVYRRKLASVFGSRKSAQWLGAAFGEVQRYLLVKLAVSAANGVLLGTWCWIWGIDSPLLWGVVAFALNFIPYIGSLIAAVPPIALGLVSGGPAIAIAVASGYVAVNLLVDNTVEPRVMGRALGLSPLVVLLSMLLWGFVLGPVGAILAVPLTMTAKILLEHDQDLAPIAVFLGDGSELVAAKRA
jgi:predicted PurR-regulated permease PerM